MLIPGMAEPEEPRRQLPLFFFRRLYEHGVKETAIELLKKEKA